MNSSFYSSSIVHCTAYRLAVLGNGILGVLGSVKLDKGNLVADATIDNAGELCLQHRQLAVLGHAAHEHLRRWLLSAGGAHTAKKMTLEKEWEELC